MKIDYYTPKSSHAGKTYGEWTAEWWKWVLSIPENKNPLLDETGQNASENQQKDVWFLAGINVENEDKKFPSRQCTIPASASILIPVLNCEADSMYYPELKNDQAIIDHVLKEVGTVEKIECYVNGELIPPQKVSSDPQIFDMYVHPDFDRYHRRGGNIRATSDGYWVFLKPLPKGEYNIRFSGSYEHGRLKSGASYKIKIN